VMQYVPASSWQAAEQFPGVFQVRDGVHRLEDLGKVGLLY